MGKPVRVKVVEHPAAKRNMSRLAGVVVSIVEQQRSEQADGPEKKAS